MTDYLRAENLTIIRQHRLLFPPLDLILSAGAGIHLIGANGSGKTTLVKLLAGTLPCAYGSVQRKSSLLFLGHKPGVKGLFTVRENIALFAQLYHGMCKQPRQNLQRRIEQAMRAVALEKLANRPLRALSAGQQRRVQLARLWLDTPPLWLLDEPLNLLDRETILRFGSRCSKHLGNGGALLITSHQELPFQDARIRTLDLCSPRENKANGTMPL